MTLHTPLLTPQTDEHEDAAVVASVSPPTSPRVLKRTASTYLLLSLRRQLWLIVSLASVCIAAFGLGRYTAPKLAHPATALQYNELASHIRPESGRPAAPDRLDYSPPPYPTGAPRPVTPRSSPDAFLSPHRVDNASATDISKGMNARLTRRQPRAQHPQGSSEQAHETHALTMPHTQVKHPLRDTVPANPVSDIALLENRDPYIDENGIRAVLETQPGSLPALSALGAQLAAQQRWEEARQTFDRALHFAPTSADLLFNAAVCADRLGRRASARGLYARALDAAGIETASFQQEDVRLRIEALDEERASP